MAGYGPSTSGRVGDRPSLSFNRAALGIRQSSSSTRYGLRRRNLRQRGLSCQAIALPDRLQLPLIRLLHQLFRPAQEAAAETSLIEAREDAQQSAWPLQSLLKQATFVALNVGVKLTSVAVRLAKHVVVDMRRSVRRLQVQQHIVREAKAARHKFSAEAVQKYELARETMCRHGKDLGFVQMLHVLDRSHMDHDAKWALVQKHTADKEDFCERLQHLYKAACESKEAVETMLRPGASRAEINSFWKSDQTAALIAEEESLKQLVFAQMLQAT